MSLSLIRALFLAAGVYDFVIGVAFLVAGPKIFEMASVPPPNHWGYIQFCALLLMIFGAAFLAVARDPVSNRNLIFYGILLKMSYVGLVGYYTLTTGCPTLFQPFAVIDAIMLVLFVAAYRKRPSA